MIPLGLAHQRQDAALPHQERFRRKGVVRLPHECLVTLAESKQLDQIGAAAQAEREVTNDRVVDILMVAHLQGELSCPVDQREAGIDRIAPELDELGKDDQDFAHHRTVLALFGQLHRQLTEIVPGLVFAESRAQPKAIENESVGRKRRDAVAQRIIHHLQAREHQQIRTEKIRGREQRHKNLERRDLVCVGQQRSMQEIARQTPAHPYAREQELTHEMRHSRISAVSDSKQREGSNADLDRLLVAFLARIQEDLGQIYFCLFELRARVFDQQREKTLSSLECAGEVFALHGIGVQLKWKLVTGVPFFFVEQLQADREVAKRVRVSEGVARLAAGNQVQIGHVALFVFGDNQFPGVIEVVEHIHLRAVYVLRRQPLQTPPADLQAEPFLSTIGDEVESSLLNTVVQKTESSWLARLRVVTDAWRMVGRDQEVGADTRHQPLVDIRPCGRNGHLLCLERAAYASGCAQDILSGRGQPSDAHGQEIENVLGDRFRLNPSQVGPPGPAAVVERDYVGVVEEIEKLRQIKRIALAAGMKQLSQRHGLLRGLRQRFLDER